jgi:hypothetical protein
MFWGSDVVVGTDVTRIEVGEEQGKGFEMPRHIWDLGAV